MKNIQSGAHFATRSGSSFVHLEIVEIFFRPLPPFVAAVSILLLRLSRLIARCRLASSSSLCQGVMNLSAHCADIQ